MHIDVNGTRLWFDVDGAALVAEGREMRARPTVILLHGGPGSFDHTYFKPDFGRLTEVAQVVYLDLRDHGRSAWGDPAAWTLEACADDIPALCGALGIEKPIVLGHSLGGYVAMLYGVRHPGHAGALVLQSTAARHDVQRIIEGFRRAGGDDIAAVARRVYAGEPPPVSREEWAPCWKLFGPWVLGERERARAIPNVELNAGGLAQMRDFDVVSQLGRIACPTLVCVGSLDPVTPVAASSEIMEALHPGIGRLEVIEGAGHFTWKDAPDRYWPTLMGFVSSVSRERAVRA